VLCILNCSALSRDKMNLEHGFHPPQLLFLPWIICN